MVEKSGKRGGASDPRVIAAQVLLDVEQHDAYANLLLPARLRRSRLSHSDAAFATELTYGTSRNQGWYDAIIASASGRTVTELDAQVRVTLRLAAHQSLHLDTPPHAVVDQAVKLIRSLKYDRASGLVNAVCRRITEKSDARWQETIAASLSADAYLAARYSHPAWIVRALTSALRADGRQDELTALLAANNSAPPVQLVALPPHADRSNTALAPTEFSPIGMVLASGDPRSYVGSGVRVQDQGSQLVALALAASLPSREQERWLDVCAGPGGKTAVLAAVAGDDVELTANEPVHHRSVLVERALAEAGVASDRVTHLHEDGRTLLADEPEGWDRIMIDAPCTGLGALRRRPESRWRKKPSDLVDLSSLQFELLTTAVTALKPGGVIAYSTCSPHPAETTKQIKRLLQNEPNITMMDTGAVLHTIAPSLELGTLEYGCQLWPHVHQTDAMYLCLLTKTG